MSNVVKRFLENAGLLKPKHNETILAGKANPSAAVQLGYYDVEIKRGETRRVRDLLGSLKARVVFNGAIKAKDVGGDALLDVVHDGEITVGNIGGNALINLCHGGNISTENIGGDMVLDSVHGGFATVGSVGGTVHLSSAHYAHLSIASAEKIRFYERFPNRPTDNYDRRDHPELFLAEVMRGHTGVFPSTAEIDLEGLDVKTIEYRRLSNDRGRRHGVYIELADLQQFDSSRVKAFADKRHMPAIFVGGVEIESETQQLKGYHSQQRLGAFRESGER